ncbi:MAG: C39 family peptidase, partial [Planktothrix sp.]
MVTYLGPGNILIDQPIVLVGIYDPQQCQTVLVMAEDKYPLTVDLNGKAGIWSVSLENGFNTAGKRWLRLQGKDYNNNIIADSVIDLMVNQEGMNTRSAYRVIPQQDTLLKIQPIDSSQLNDQQKASFKIGDNLVVDSIELVNDHLKLELNNPLPNLGKFIYVYQPHIVVTKGSKLLWFNPNQLPEHSPGNQLLWVTQTTSIKMKPDDLSQLASDQFIEMPQGSAYSIIGYACVAEHFRVTLNQQFPGFGQSGYLYRHHVKILENTQEIPFDNNAITCMIINTTPLKKRPIDSAYLESSEKITLTAGMIYGIQSYTSESGHIKVTLTENFPDFGNTGYLYPDFIALNRGNLPLIVNKTLTYQGATEVLVNTPLVLKGTFDPNTTAEITLFAEDRYSFNINLDREKSTWETQVNSGFSDAGYRWLRLKAIDSQGNVTASRVINITVSENPMTVGESLTLDILEDTLFKIVPFDSSSLNQQQKVAIKAGQTFKVLKYGLVDGHLKIVLENALPPVGNFGYIYTDNLRLKKGSEVFRFDIDEVPDTDINAQMLVTETTKIKAQPVDSSNLEPRQFEQLLLGQTLAIKGYA